jgi:hypothetical protein
MVLANLSRAGSGVDTENSLYPWTPWRARIEELGRPETGDVLKCARVSYEGNLVSSLILTGAAGSIFNLSRILFMGIT